MGPPNDDEFELKLDEDPEKYHRRILARGMAVTANAVMLILVGGVLLSLLLYTVSAWCFPATMVPLDGFFDKWFKFVSPFVGTAVGFYFGSNKSNRS